MFGEKCSLFSFVAVMIIALSVFMGCTPSTTSTGSLSVTLSPQAAVTARGAWQVDGDWQVSGATVSGLSVGTHPVSFKEVAGFTSPVAQSAVIEANKTATLVAAYSIVSIEGEDSEGEGEGSEGEGEGSEGEGEGEGIWYVNGSNMKSSPDGKSWATAFPDIQSAINAIYNAGGGEVWVAKGLYTASSNPVVVMKEGVRLYGGFEGTEKVLTERDWMANTTTIDGQNARRCINGDNNTRLDGFTIAHGHAFGIYGTLGGYDASLGGGIWGGAITIANCTFNENSASGFAGFGGAIASNSSLTVTNCIFSENTSKSSGGAIHSGGGAAALEIVDCIFKRNIVLRNDVGLSTEANGGGVSYSGSLCRMNNCVFEENETGYGGSGAGASISGKFEISNCKFIRNMAGGALAWYNAGITDNEGMITDSLFDANLSDHSGGAISMGGSYTVSGCTFRNNRANTSGGAISDAHSKPTLVNCLFVGNSAQSSTDACYFSGSDPILISNCTFSENYGSRFRDGLFFMECVGTNIITNSVFWKTPIHTQDSRISVIYSCAENGYSGEGNISGDPLFMDIMNGDLRLHVNSPCLDVGAATDAPSTDIVGRPRPQGSGFDMGAYEGAVISTDIVHLTLQVSPSGGGSMTPGAGTHAYQRGDGVPLVAHPLGMRFTGWTGDIAAATPTATVMMDDDKTVTANFIENIFFVNVANTASMPNGRSWPSAFQTIQQGVDAAQDGGGGEVWVVAGTYTATSDQVLKMRDGVSLYGGFMGAETTRSARNWTANCTIIDGENARRCVIGVNNATLDGFTIIRGKTNDFNGGAGMYNSYSSPTVMNCVFTENTASNRGGGGMYNAYSSSPIVANCTFTSNTAEIGSGMYNYYNSSPTVTDCTFTGNTGSGDYGSGGGGMYNMFSSSPTVANCTFTGNTAATGGGMSNSYASSPTVTNCMFTENTASGTYGGSGGGMSNDTNLGYAATSCAPTVTNCTFKGNTASNGGGMCNVSGSTAAADFPSPTVTNCTFTGNIASNYGGGIHNTNISPTVTNCIFWGDTATTGPEFSNGSLGDIHLTVTYSCVQGGYTGTGNIDVAPMFVDVANGNLRLQDDSPCINTGTETGAPPTDITGTVRPQGAGYDMGAYER